MVRGLYTAAMGMMTSQAQVDMISQNLANVNTPGYCKDEALEMSFPQMMLSRLDSNGATAIGQAGTGNTMVGTYTSFDEGADQETGNPFDLALHGNAFFTVQDGQGQTDYTRNGDFALNQQGQLVTNAGDAVLGETDGQQQEIFVPERHAGGGKRRLSERRCRCSGSMPWTGSCSVPSQTRQCGRRSATHSSAARPRTPGRTTRCSRDTARIPMSTRSMRWSS